jgi:hypothetical protein
LRYAILFSGMSFRRHVNGLEFCYRTLVERLGYAAENVYVLSYDGSSRAYGDVDAESCGVWPGDGTAYRMVVNAEGSRDAFRRTLGVIGEKLQPQDRIFINTTGHGGHHGGNLGPELLTHPYGQRYKRSEFCADLATLPPHRCLVVLMAQCFSGGFNRAVIDASRAESTFIASASEETRPSFMVLDDPNWDSFQRLWIAGLSGYDVDGTPIRSEPWAAANGRFSVGDAFRYATTCAARSLYDSPEYAAYPDSAMEITLASEMAMSAAAEAA